MKRLIRYMMLTVGLTISGVPAIALRADDAPVMDVEAVEAFVDAYWAKNAEAQDTPGMAIALVHDGKTVFSKGYGVSNLISGEAVDPGQTVFRLASISKVFVSIAVLQQVEAGTLSLDTDIQQYVPDIPIDNPFKTRITLRHLLTHQGGFDDRIRGDMALRFNDLEPLGGHLARRMPPVVREPGTVSSYSNYGYALAGYIVEKVAGQSFADYARQHIFLPLGMTHTDYRLSLDLAGFLATGYEDNGDGLEAQPYTYVHRYPPTSALSTATDMARFARAMLNGGCLGDVCLFGEKARKLMFERQYSPHPLMPGRSLAFMEWARNSQTGWWHDGGHVGFLSDLILFPESGTGLFIAVNSKEGGIPNRLKQAFLDEFMPYGQSPPKAIGSSAALNRLTGDYRFTRRTEMDMEKVAGLMADPVTVSLDGDGGLVFAGMKMVQIAPLVFAEADVGRFRIAFQADAGGRGLLLHADWGGAPRTFDPLMWWDQPALHRAVLAVLLAGNLLAAAMLWRRRKAIKSACFWPSFLAVTLLAAFMIDFAVFMATTSSTMIRLNQTPELSVLTRIPMIASVLLLCGAIWALLQRQKMRLVWAAYAWTFLTLIELSYWNLMG